MTGRLTALILLCTVYLIETAEVSHQISTKVVEVGGNVTLHCSFSDGDGQSFYLYKQFLGYLAQTIVAVIRGVLSEQFNNPRFTATKEDAQYSLTIRNVSKEDEATYFCLIGGTYSQRFVDGIFLAVNDRNQQKSFYVKQSPETESVQPGDSVTLQCSLLSKNKENADQCPDEQDVYWFRSGSRESHPGIIYTHSDEQEERSCVYSLSKTIQSSSDTGTYYCAVVTCGEILFGEGTKVETRNDCGSGSELDPVVLVLGVLLACCAIVIVVLIFYGNQRKVCEHCKAPVSASHHHGYDRSTVDLSNDLDGGLNYAALDFSTRKDKRGKRKTRESPQECCTLLLEQITTTSNTPLYRPSTACAKIPKSLQRASAWVCVHTYSFLFPTDIQ